MNTISYIKIHIKIVFCRNYTKVHPFKSTLNKPNQNTLYLKIRMRTTKIRLAKSKIRSYLLTNSIYLMTHSPVKSSSSSSCSVIRWRLSPSLAALDEPLALFFIFKGDLALLEVPMKWAKTSVCWSKNSKRLPRPPSLTFEGATSAGVGTEDEEVDPLELDPGLAILYFGDLLS